MTSDQTPCIQCGSKLQLGTKFCTHCGAPVGEMKVSTSPQLNPFAFPSDTHFRFILLIATVLGASLFIYGDFYHTVVREESLILYESDARKYFLWMLAGSSVTLLIAITIYWWLPTWRIKRSALRPLNDQAVPGITAYLAELCQTAGLTRTPQFLWNALDQTKEGYAFGRFDSAYVYLPRGLVNAYKQNLPEFRAIALHELAHIRNGDVHRTYFSFAIWWSFLVTALPLFAIALIQTPPERIIGMGVRVLILYFLVYLTRNSVLRVREFYADLRSSIWSNDSSALKLALESAVHSTSKISFWKRIWLTHPDLGDRRHILEKPTPLFQMSFWTAFATGIAAMLPFASFFSVLTLAFISPDSSILFKNFTLYFPAFLVAFLCVSIVGLGTWRTVITATLSQRRITGINKLACGLALGLLVGQQFSFVGLPKILLNPFFLILWLGFLSISLMAFLRWLVLGVQAWMGILSSRRLVNRFYRWGTLAAGGTLALFLASVLRSIFIFEGGDNLGHFNLVFNHYFSFALISLWAFPFASCFLHKRMSSSQFTVSNSFFLDDLRSPLIISNPIKLRFILPSIIGLVFGICGYLLLLDFSNGMGLNVIYSICLASIIMQIMVSAIVAIFIKHLSSAYAIYAAFLSACSMSLISEISPYFNVQDIFFFAVGVINSGGLFIIPTVSIISLIKFLIASKISPAKNA